VFPWVLRINPAGWSHLFLFGLLLPVTVLLLRGKTMPAAGPLPNRMKHFQRTSFELVIWLLVSLAVARAEWMQLFPRAVPTVGAVAAGLAVLAAQVAYMWPRWRKAVTSNARVVHLFMPTTVAERAWWLTVAVLAGVGEEITYRGVLWALLANLTGNYLLSAVLASLAFGAGHMVQGWRSSAVIVCFGLSFHLLVWIAGSLYVAMAVHVTYDVIAGLNYGRLGKQLNYAPQAA
jgi:membrane protease YdiL (CAAX protease family)